MTDTELSPWLLLVVLFSIVLLTNLFVGDTIEFQSRIDQCNANQTLDYPEDTRSPYNLFNNIGYGGIHLLLPCEHYRNKSVTLGILHD